MQENRSSFSESKLLGLPSELFELFFSFIPFKESNNFRISHPQLQSAFLHYFRRVFREYLIQYNECLKIKFNLIDGNDELYIEKYQQEFERVQNELNCKIPFLLKELLMMTIHFNAESNDGKYNVGVYPVHWFNSIKSWKREGNVVRISDVLVLIPNGKYNNRMISLYGYNGDVDLYYSIFCPNAESFDIKANSFSNHCNMEFDRGVLCSLSGVTSIPLALSLLKYFTIIDPSPRNLNKLVSIISPDLYSNKEFLYRAVKIYLKITKQIPQRLFDDRDFCLRLVKSHGKTLKYCTKFFQDKELVIQALKQNGFAIKYLTSHYLRSNQDLLDIAITSKPYSLDYIPNSSPNFRKMVIKALNQIEEMKSIPIFVNNDEYLQDKEIVEIILKKNPELISKMPTIWKDCRPLARKLVSFDPFLITGFSPKVIKDPRIEKMIAEVKPSLLSLIYNSESKLKLVQKVLNAWGLPPFNYRDDEETMTQILGRARINPNIYSFILNLPNFGCNCSDLLKFTFITEGISKDPSNIFFPRVMEIISRLSIDKQEEMLKIFLNSNPNPSSTSNNFSFFNIYVLDKYILEGYKKGIKLRNGFFAKCETPDDILECLEHSEYRGYLCLHDEIHKDRYNK